MHLRTLTKMLFNKLQKLLEKDYQEPLGDYSLSAHAEDYERIAQELNTDPQYVYDIAHGMGIKTYDDRVIWEKLLDEGIVNSADK
ncbi:MAG: hypothetical protein K6C30_04290 [Bacteroidaceae bacterium]|nr:hypothetical protein [Bacteroidaceae bacterium]